MTKPAKSLEFDPAAFEDLAWWVENDRKKALRIIKLIREIQRDPFSGALLKKDSFFPVPGLIRPGELFKLEGWTEWSGLFS